jgi:oligopeptide transport system ATP-binding protein
MLEPPPGCPFAPRCGFSMQICDERAPDPTDCGNGHEVRCWLTDARAGAQRFAFEEARKEACKSV